MTISEECPSALLSCCVLPAAAAVEIVAALTHRRISQQKTERPSWEIAKIRIQSELHLIFLWMHFVHNSPIFRAGYETLVLLAKGTTNMWAPGQHSRGQRNNFWLEIKAFSSTNWSTARQRQTHRHRVEMGRAALHWEGAKSKTLSLDMCLCSILISHFLCVCFWCVCWFSAKSSGRFCCMHSRQHSKTHAKITRARPVLRRMTIFAVVVLCAPLPTPFSLRQYHLH